MGVDIKQFFVLRPGWPVLIPFGTFGDLISVIVQFLFAIAFMVAFFFIIYGGFRWITSGGDEKAVADARNTLTFAIIGLLVVFLSFFFIKLIEAFTHISILG